MARWIHSYILKIGSPIPISSITDPNTGAYTAPIDINASIQKSKSKANAYILTEHQINFNITKDNTKEANMGTITITNASSDLVNYLSTNVKNHVAVVLQAGYVGEVKTIFSGTIERLSDKKQGTDRLTELSCRDGAVNITEAITSRAYPKNTPIKNIVKDLAGDLGTPIGAVVIDTTTPKTIGPVHFIGSTHNNMHSLAQSINHNYSIQDGALYFTPQTSKLPKSSVYISAASGLIGSPEPLTMSEGVATPKKKKNKTELTTETSLGVTGESTTKKKKKSEIPTEGIKFKCQLDGAILPESTIWINSIDYNVGMKVYKVTHTGNFEGSEWCSEVECVYV